MLWVHATLLDSIPLIYDRLVRPLTTAERDEYCAEAASVAIDLGAREHEVPRTWGALRAYLDRTYASGSIAVSAQARELASAVLAPPFAIAVAPAAWLNRLITIGLLPDRIRTEYGFSWNARRERALARVASLVRIARRLTPSAVALWPESVSGRRLPRSRPDTPAA